MYSSNPVPAVIAATYAIALLRSRHATIKKVGISATPFARVAVAIAPHTEAQRYCLRSNARNEAVLSNKNSPSV